MSQATASSRMQAQSSWTVLTRESNVLLLRSFQIIHEVRMTKVSKALRSTLVNFLREEVDQVARSNHRPSGVSECHRSLCKTRYQICLANEQLSNKCELTQILRRKEHRDHHLVNCVISFSQPSNSDHGGPAKQRICIFLGRVFSSNIWNQGLRIVQ